MFDRQSTICDLCYLESFEKCTKPPHCSAIEEGDVEHRFDYIKGNTIRCCVSMPKLKVKTMSMGQSDLESL